MRREIFLFISICLLIILIGCASKEPVADSNLTDVLPEDADLSVENRSLQKQLISRGTYLTKSGEVKVLAPKERNKIRKNYKNLPDTSSEPAKLNMGDTVIIDG